MGMKTLSFVALGIILIFGMMTYYPYSGQTSLTSNPEGIIFDLETSSNWTDDGTVNNLNSNGLLYPSANERGNWTSFSEELRGAESVRVRAEGDPSGGNIKIRLRLYEDSLSGSPDDVIEYDMTTTEFEKEFSTKLEAN